MGRGKSKGNAFERKICNKLSLWWSEDEDDVFWRSQSSGARATSRSKVGKHTAGQHGDICATDSRGQALTKVAVIELKVGYNAENFSKLFESKDNTESIFTSWIRDAARDAHAAKSLGWMLIWQHDRKEPILIISQRIIQGLYNNACPFAVAPPKPYAMLWFSVNDIPLQVKQIKRLAEKGKKPKSTDHQVFVCRLDDFLANVTKKQIKLLYKRMKIDAEKHEGSKLSKNKKKRNKVRSKRNRISWGK